MKSPVKWVGGKAQLLDEILPLIPKFKTYCEPFFGGGAVFWALEPKRAVINDINHELINLYRVIKYNPKELMREIDALVVSEDEFYAVRAYDRDLRKFQKMNDIQKAARTLYLNKTCYNGMYRVNKDGFFNVPYGKYKTVNIYDRENILKISAYLEKNNINIMSVDYRAAGATLKAGDFVFIDSPYDPVSETASFTSYTEGGFDRVEQERLHNWCLELDQRGIKFMETNASTDFIHSLYSGFNIKVVKAKRAINSKGDKRGPVDEVIITNYDTE